MEDRELHMRSAMASRLRKEYFARKKENPDFFMYDFARLLGVSDATLSQILSLERKPSLSVACRICERLGWSVDYFIGLTDIKCREWTDYEKACQLITKETGIDIKYLHELKGLPRIGLYFENIEAYLGMCEETIREIKNMYNK